MSLDSVYKKLDDELTKALEHLREEFAGLQIGRASGALVDRVTVESYGTMQPLKAVANISVPDARTIQIQPWDRANLPIIEKAIILAELGLNPQNDGVVIRLNVPPLTEERRKELSKIVSKISEESKIGVRNARHEAMEDIKKLQKDNDITEDQQSAAEKTIQGKVDVSNSSIEEAAKAKEADVMKV
jgi:ribosome recycling factor